MDSALAARLAALRSASSANRSLDREINNSTPEQRLRLLAAWIVSSTDKLMLPYAEPIIKLVDNWFGDCSKADMPAIGSYPVVCSNCGTAIGTSMYRASIQRDSFHCTGVHSRKLCWQTCNHYLVAKKLNIHPALLEHHIVLQELSYVRLNEEFNRQLLSSRHFNEVASLDP